MNKADLQTSKLTAKVPASADDVQYSRPIKAVNSLESLMKAVSNLDLMAKPSALKEKIQEEEAENYILLTLP